MYKPTFNKRHVLVFRQFGNRGWSLFACLGREVVCSVLSVSTLTYASAESVSTDPVTADSIATKTDREQMLDEVSVTGSRAPLTKSQAARMVTVLDRADIQQAPVQSVNDLLKYAVGVDVRQRGPIGAQTDISIRGGTQEQIIVLLNGINICDPQTGHNVMDLPVQLSEIVRIEVLEGPAGRAYGTASLVGAVNIVTVGAVETGAKRSATSLDLSAEGGSFGYANIGFRLAHSTQRPQPVEGSQLRASGQEQNKSALFTQSLSGSYARSDGYSRSKAGALNTDFSGAKAFYQGIYTDGQTRVNWHVGLTDKGWGSSTFYASPRWQADDQYEHTTKVFAAVQAQVRAGALYVAPTAYFARHHDRYEGYRGRPDLMKYNYNRSHVCGLSLNSHFDWVGGRTAIGAEARNEDLVSGNLGEPLATPKHISGTDRDYTLGINRTNLSAYFEHNILLRALTVSAGLVATKNTWADMDWRVYPGIDASLRIGSRWKLHASFNTSLRMPSFTEMYYKLQGYAADPHLKPEEMNAVEAGVAYSAPACAFHAALWHHHGRNMIDWIMDTTAGDKAEWKSVNHTRLDAIGAEAGLTVDVRKLLSPAFPATTLTLTYSYMNQDKKLEEHLVSQYALEYLHHKLVGRLKTNIWRRMDLSVAVRWQDRVGAYMDFAGAVCDYRPFALADARIQWTASRYVLYAEVNNIFNNRHYVDYGNVPQPGAWLVVGTRWRFE